MEVLVWLSSYSKQQSKALLTCSTNAPTTNKQTLQCHFRTHVINKRGLLAYEYIEILIYLQRKEIVDFVFQNVKPVRYEVDTSVVRSETTGFYAALLRVLYGS